MVAELVPWRGPLAGDAGAHARSLAARLRADGRVAAVSITDGAGGHATLSPEVFAGELHARGDHVIVHVSCRDPNRNELLSLGWRLSSAGIENVLAITGDYPREGAFGLARPVVVDDDERLNSAARTEEGHHGRAQVIGRPAGMRLSISITCLLCQRPQRPGALAG
jgi:5,10-methylenetetrahydrofolate reductase